MIPGYAMLYIEHRVIDADEEKRHERETETDTGRRVRI